MVSLGLVAQLDSLHHLHWVIFFINPVDHMSLQKQITHHFFLPTPLPALMASLSIWNNSWVPLQLIEISSYLQSHSKTHVPPLSGLQEHKRLASSSSSFRLRSSFL